MRRIEGYGRKMAAGLMAAVALMLGFNGLRLESFAMTETTPFSAKKQELSSIGTLIIPDETKTQETAADPNLPPVLSTAPTAAFGSVTTPVMDSSSLFGPGRLTLLANKDTNAQSLSVIIENGAGGLIVVDGGWTNNGQSLLNEIKQRGGHVAAYYSSGF